LINQFTDDHSHSFNFDKFFINKLEAKKTDHTYRYFKHIVRNSETFPVAHEQITKESDDKRQITIWCSNDYLGLGRHPYVKSEVMNAVDKYGAGSGGTRNISGSTPLHSKLEIELSKLHQKEAALLFTSCYVANDTTLFTLAKMLPKCHIFSDSGNHASMIQGIRNSGVPKHIFRHNDAKHLEELLKTVPIETPKIVAFESVHSMDGSICDIEEMCDITHKYGGLAFVDEVHAVGLYGKNGAGVGERDDVLAKMDIISGTLGKAFGNVGGYIAGTHALIDTIRSFGAGFIFTTSLPPSVVSGSMASIKISCSDEGRELRTRHQHNATVLKRRLMAAGLPVMNSPSHIVPIFVGNAQHATDICNILLRDYGIYIQSINYPTVARGEERLRIVPTPLHTDKMIDDLVNALVKVWTECDLQLKMNAISNARKCKTCKSEVNEDNWKQNCKNFVLNKKCEAMAC
jgi:5-aminolevulinate synthase